MNSTSSVEVSHGSVSPKMFTVDFSEEDQSTKFGLKVVAAISGGKISCWPIWTSIFQSRALTSCPASGLGGGWLGFFCPSWINVGAVMEFDALKGKELVALLLLSRAAARLLRTWLCLQV